MNEKIKAIYLQAMVTEETYPVGCNGNPTIVSSIDYEKFAKLIVNACADAADEHVYDNDRGDYVWESFGFENGDRT